MKKYLGILVIVLFILALCGVPVHAATFGISSSKTQVKPNESFTVSIGGQCIGRVNISVSNGTASTSSIWVEQNYVPVTITAGSSGSVVVTATPTPGFSDPDANEYAPGARSTAITIYQKASTSTTTQKPVTNPNKPVTNTNQTTTQTKQEKPKSSNNLLSSLTIENSNLSPKFQANVSQYTVNFPANTEKVNIGAKTADNKAKIEGVGEIVLKERRQYYYN